MISRVHSVGFTVADMERSLDFYTRLLPFGVVSQGDVSGSAFERLIGIAGARAWVVTLALGSAQIQLTQFTAPQSGRPIPPGSRSHDRWFQHLALVVSDMDAAYARLQTAGVEQVSTAPQTLPLSIPAAAGIRAFYFRDPDGHNLELIWYPPDKGQPRWQSRDSLFLGIDHTAIAVADTAVSRYIYERLGFEVAGSSLNFGREQEHLNGVPGCRVQITGWRAGDGVGVEFLEYLAPQDGHDYPPDSTITDLWHWETTLVCEDIDTLLLSLQPFGVVSISAEIIQLPQVNPYGWSRGFLLRDADGHAIKLVEA